jgi:hypothetical protein
VYDPGGRQSSTAFVENDGTMAFIFIRTTPSDTIRQLVSNPNLSTLVLTRTRCPRLPSGNVQVPDGTRTTDLTLSHQPDVSATSDAVSTPSILEVYDTTLATNALVVHAELS